MLKDTLIKTYSGSWEKLSDIQTIQIHTGETIRVTPTLVRDATIKITSEQFEPITFDYEYSKKVSTNGSFVSDIKVDDFVSYSFPSSFGTKNIPPKLIQNLKDLKDLRSIFLKWKDPRRIKLDKIKKDVLLKLEKLNCHDLSESETKALQRLMLESGGKPKNIYYDVENYILFQTLCWKLNIPTKLGHWYYSSKNAVKVVKKNNTLIEQGKIKSPVTEVYIKKEKQRSSFFRIDFDEAYINLKTISGDFVLNQ